MKILHSAKNILVLFVTLILCCCACSTIAETETKDVSNDELISEPTPLPPLVDAQPEPNYEPSYELSITSETTDSITNATTSQTNEQSDTPTPQPPLIDAQPEPNYEPDTTLAEETSNPLSTQQSALWLNTRPKRVSADWLQLTSGEWLRGRVLSMQQENLEFDSDELDSLDIEWKKVKYLKSYEPYSLRFDDNTTTVGAIEITEDKVLVNTDYDDQEFDRHKLLIIASGKDTELSLWSAKISLSLDIRKGNTNQTDFTTRANAKRRTLLSRLILDYSTNFTSVDDKSTVNNHRLNSTYDIFINRDIFWTLISAEYYRDPFQNIEKRINIYTALGYAVINSSKTEWNISAGPGFQETRYVSVQEGPIEDSTFVFVLSTAFDTKINSKVDLEGLYTATLGDDNTGNYTHHSLITIETDLTKNLNFDVTITWDRTHSPVPDENNITPEQDDIRFLIGLSYEL